MSIKDTLFTTIEEKCQENQHIYTNEIIRIGNLAVSENREIDESEIMNARKVYFDSCCDSMKQFISFNYPDYVSTFQQYLDDPALCFPEEYNRDQLRNMVKNDGISAGILFSICLRTLTDEPIDTYESSHLSHIQNEIMTDSIKYADTVLSEEDTYTEQNQNTKSDKNGKGEKAQAQKNTSKSDTESESEKQKNNTSKKNDNTINTDDDDDDDEITDLLSKHMYLRMIAEQKVSTLKKYLAVLMILLLCASGFGIYEYLNNQSITRQYEDEKENLKEKYKDGKNTILKEAKYYLDWYSESVAFVTDPQTVYYHKPGCPELNTDRYYYNTINNWKSQGKVSCPHCYSKKYKWKDILTD